MQVSCFIYRVIVKNNSINLLCVDKDSKQVIITDSEFKPFFYILDAKKKVKDLECVWVNKYFLGVKKKVLKVTTSFDDFNDVVKSFEEKDSLLSGHDLNFDKTYLAYKELSLNYWIDFDVKKSSDDLLLVDFKIKDKINSPDFIVFDIETYSNFGDGIDYEKPVLMISVVTKNSSTILLYKKSGFSREMLFNDEKEMIEYFFDYLSKNEESILIGFNSDGFDLPYLFYRAKKLKIENVPSFTNRRSFSSKSVDFDRMIHFDLYQFFKNIYRTNVKSNSLSLNSLSLEFLGQKKIEVSSITELYDNNVKKLAEYCEKDSVLTKDLFLKILNLCLEFSRITNLDLYSVVRSGFSVFVENYYVKELTKFDELVPRKPTYHELKQRFKNLHRAAIVLEPVPGIVRGVCQLDFRSLYPSIISAYRISPEKRGLIPDLLKELILKRDDYKKQEGMKDLVEVFKVLSNSAYGYLVFDYSRWYGFEQAQEVTKIGRKSLLGLKSFFEKKNIPVLYGDTDSVFIKSSKDVAISSVKEINKGLKYPMFLKLEDYYPKGIFVGMKSSARGAKKKYAFRKENDELLIKGFATIRRDWCNFAKKAQFELLELVLKKDYDELEVKTFAHKKIRLLEKNEVSKDDLVLKGRLRKQIVDYKVNTPIVSVAKKLVEKGFKASKGTIISYLVLEGKGGVGEKSMPLQLLEKDYVLDKDYYINKQLMPVLNEILNVLGIKL